MRTSTRNHRSGKTNPIRATGREDAVDKRKHVSGIHSSRLQIRRRLFSFNFTKEIRMSEDYLLLNDVRGYARLYQTLVKDEQLHAGQFDWLYNLYRANAVTCSCMDYLNPDVFFVRLAAVLKSRIKRGFRRLRPSTCCCGTSIGIRRVLSTQKSYCVWRMLCGRTTMTFRINTAANPPQS